MQDEMLIGQFQQLYDLIKQARSKAIFFANREHLNLYWQVGADIDAKLAGGSWGDKVVDQFAEWLNQKDPGIKNFDRRNIYRMREFFLAYATLEIQEQHDELSIVGSVKPQTQIVDNEQEAIVVSAKPQFPNIPDWLSNIPWTHHIHILSAAKEPEERMFYILLTAQEKYTVQELKRQLKTSLYERQKLSSKSIVPLNHPHSDKISQIFRDRYVFEFLDMEEPLSEHDLKKGLITKLKKFLLELGRDFIFMGEEYRLVVGIKDFNIDLLFYHRDLQCLVAFELKTVAFEPEHLGKLNFYLEALDRDVKKAHEHPSIGILLCKTKNNTEVEYALSRNISPALVAEYQTKLIDKGILKKLLSEWSENIEDKNDI
jgi:predicted nuclease of restriction endonuclease-like (RecB) superfamily